nr:hypothetical protein Itr_chr03CG07670 [Ipomoea trifida]
MHADRSFLPQPRTTAESQGEKNHLPLDRCGEAAGRKKRRCSPLEEIRRTTAAAVARVLAKLDETEVTGSKGENARRQALLLRLSRGVPLPPPIIITHAPPPAHEKGREAIPLTFVATPYLPEELRGAESPVAVARDATAARRRKEPEIADCPHVLRRSS